MSALRIPTLHIILHRPTWIKLICTTLVFIQGASANAQGQSDGTWSSPSYLNGDFDNSIDAIALQSDGKVIVAGNFATFYGQPRVRIARLHPNGTFDATFDPGVGPSGPVRDVIVRPDGKILIAGEFSFYAGGNANAIALLNTDGSLNNDFNTAGVFYDLASQGIHEPGTIADMELDPLGRILIVGHFNRVQGHPTVGVARLQANGNVDEGFATPYSWNTSPTKIAAGIDFEVLVGGMFTEVDGAPHNRLIRFNYDGAIDNTFDPSGSGVDGDIAVFGPSIEDIVVRPDGKTWIAGNFAKYNGTSRPNIALLHSDGTLDNSFSGGTGPDHKVRRVAIESNGDLILAGSFDNIHGTPRPGLARMFAFGGMDVTFTPAGPSGGLDVTEMLLQPDGKILVYGTGGGAMMRRFCPAATATWYPDADGDGLGSPSGSITSCGHPVGYVSNSSDNCPNTPGLIGDDCDDGNALTLFDAVDGNCICTGLAPVSVFPWSENFTDGLGGFTLENGVGTNHEQTNQWHWGEAIGHSPPSVYVSDTQGATHNYATSAASIVHFFRDLSFPASASSLTLNFAWTGRGQLGSDALSVWLIPTSYWPDASSALTATGAGPTGRVNLTGDLNNSIPWQNASYPIPASYIGQTVRLVFEWINNGSGGTQPPAAVDNVSVCATTNWYGDSDGDGFGDPNVSLTTCGDQPTGYVLDRSETCPSLAGTMNTPCDDGDANTTVDVLGADCTCHGTGLPLNESFSNGPNGFTAANAGQVNQWFWGTATGNPAPSLYISDDQGVTNHYTNGSFVPGQPATVSHFARVLPPIPASATSIQLGFDWRSVGMGGLDRLKVWLVPTTFTPVAGEVITAAGSGPNGRVALSGDLYGQPNWTTSTYTFPSGYAGQTVKLVFEWFDDGTFTGGNPPAAVDNLRMCIIDGNGGDADGDGTAECLDPCPNLANLKNGDTCNDGNPNTNPDLVTNCVCTGPFCPIPVFEASSGTQTICQGSSFSLTPSPAWINGTMVINGYNWTGPGPIIGASASLYGSPAVYYPLPAPGPGQYVHYCTVSNACGSATYTLTTTVVPVAPTVTPSGVVHACATAGVTLTASPGTSYSWYVNNADINYHQQTLWVNTAGSYKVLVVNNNNCQGFSPTTQVFIDSPPAVTCGSYGPLCSNGASIDLVGSPIGGTWSGTGVSGNTFSPGAGTQTVTYMYTASLCAASCSTTINVQQAATWYADTDGDGFGDPAAPVQLCGLPGPAYVSDNTDDCPSVYGKVGSTCDDGSSSTIGDVLSATCVCQGELPRLAARVLLQGPYDSGTGLMSDALRTLPGFPLTQPYTALGYSGALNETGSISPSVLTVTGNDAIVDWVVIELRSPASPSTIVDMRAALLQRDGDVVGIDGVSPVTFAGASASYHVAVRHRNHLGCMTITPVTFGTTPLVLDFTNPATMTWGTNARMTSGSTMLLYMGDGNANGQVKYTGSGNDRDPILVTVGSTTPNNTVNSYSGSDINMNGQVKYTGSGNDRDPILVNVGSTTPNNTRTQQLP